MRHRAGQQTVDVGGEPHILYARHGRLLNQRIASGTRLYSQVGLGHVRQGRVTAVLVNHLAHDSSVAIAGNAEHGQRSGGLGLDAFDTALDQAMEGDLLAQHQLVNIGGVATVNQLEQAIQLVGAGLQHLKRFVGLNGIGHHLAIRLQQAGQK